MRDHRRIRYGVVSWSTFFWCTLVIVLSSVLFTTLTFSSVRPYYLTESLHPNAALKWRTHPAMEAKSSNSPAKIMILEIVILLDQVLIFLKYPPSFPFYTKRDLHCVYLSANSSGSEPLLTKPPIQLHPARLHEQIIRCPLPPHGEMISLKIKSNGPLQTRDFIVHKSNPLVYEALFDRDNTTIMFVKGLNLRPERLAEPFRFKCVYGWNFMKPKFLLKSDVISVAQEIVRCRTPVSILSDQAQIRAQTQAHSVKVSVQVQGRGIFPSIARPGLRSQQNPPKRKAHEICVCTMLRNQARFIKEWVMYHTRIGVQRWFIYDNNSDDNIENVIEFLQSVGYNITSHLWPWVKTQEAGFAHCALRARASCEWVGFIDVDEFFHVKVKGGLHHVIWHHAKLGNNVGEIRTPCYSFGPSGLRKVPKQGVMVGYTCRLVARERHKSIVRPEALNQSLINVVHHFHLSAPFVAVDVDKGVMVINHYKYQVWKVFKEKFYRRVATYVADWKEKQNVGSKDRAPGLGTKAVEPSDWPNRFCEVRDMGLRNWVLRSFMDRHTHLLPWQPEFERHFKRKRRPKEKKPHMIAF